MTVEKQAAFSSRLHRAKNVSRLGSKATPEIEMSSGDDVALAARKTGTDDDWTSF